jgi:S-DNA-T family DNA segregation ATPase FtsK/SpoIIIE
VDSRVVLDEMGAERLLGNGDMLFLLPGTSTMLRGQGTFLSDDEITRVVDFVGVDAPQFAGELMQLKTKDELEAAAGGNFQSRDELYEAAVDIVIRERRGSCSLLQRALGIGYGRAARLIDFMAEDGVVGQYNGSQARDVLITLADWEARQNQPGAEGEPASAGGRAGARAPSAADGRPPAGAEDRPARGTLQTAAPLTTATVEPRRRNKITPKLDEPSDLEDEFEDEDHEEEELEEEALAEDEEWDDEEEEQSAEDEEEESEDQDEPDEEATEDEEEYEDDDEEWEDDDAEEEEDWAEDEVTETRSSR